MKKLVVLLLLSVGALLANTARGQTAPQEQASALAVPTQAPAVLKTVITVVQCNTVIGVLGVDESGEVHPGHFTSKEDVRAVQSAVPADHNLALNVGCPGNAAKDTTVL